MTIEIPLTKGKFAIVDDCDADLALHKWCFGKRYARRGSSVYGKRFDVLMHRAILARKLGRDLESGEIVDHIDGNGLNNVRSNLRLSDYQGNVRNRSISSLNKVGYKGVIWLEDRKRYLARITVDRKQISLGFFRKVETAALAYDKAARAYFGEFAKLNFPEVTTYDLSEDRILTAIEKRLLEHGNSAEAVLINLITEHKSANVVAQVLSTTPGAVISQLKKYGYRRIGSLKGGYWSRTEKDAA